VVSAPESSARARVLDVAEQLFAERGYDAVTLHEIAQRLRIRESSFYYHFPGGKEQLFVEVTARALARHRLVLEQTLVEAGPNLRAQLLAVTRWLLSQPPIDLARMVRSDMPAIAPEQARCLTRAALEALVVPLEQAFAAARERGEITFPAAYRRERLLAASFLAIVDTLRVAERFAHRSAEDMVASMIDVLLDGLYPRGGRPRDPGRDP
jgi:AcrR family transcriptional regulator